jgi:hypothetical protein
MLLALFFAALSALAAEPATAPSFLPTLMASPVPNEVIHVVGEATGEDGKPVYVEDHTLTYGPDHRLLHIETSYRRPGEDGQEFAHDVSDFSGASEQFLPAFRFVDFRTHKEHGLTWTTAGKIEMFRKKSADGEIKKEEMKIEPGTTAGEGIFFYILDRIPQILSEDGDKVRIILPARLDDVGLRIRKKDPKSNSPVVTLKIDVNSWFLRIFTPSIEVDYDPLQKRILEYRGVSSINTDDDKVQQVKVRYRYP